MKKLLFIIICIVTLFACEDKFEQYYQGGIPALSEFSFYLYTENGGTYISFEDEKGKYCEISVDHQFWRNSVTAKLPSNSATYKMRLDANVDWKFSNLPEWISISPSDGSPKMSFYDGHSAYYENDTISFTVSENTYVSPRFANVYLEGYKDEWKRVDTLRFTQYGISSTIDGEDETITMKAKADTVFRYINSNCDFEVECSNSYWSDEYDPVEWLTAEVAKSDKAGFTHKIIISSGGYMTNYDYREGYLRCYVPMDNGSKQYFDYQLTIRKQEPYITISEEEDSWRAYEISVAPQNCSTSVLVNSNCDFEIIGNASWINLGNKSYKYSSTAQEIEIHVDDYSFAGNENYDSNGDIGGGTSSAETYSEYRTYYDRTSALKLCYINSSDTIVIKTISVTQAKPTIKQYDNNGNYSSYIETVTFNPTAGTQEVFITANYPFHIAHEDWFSVKAEAIEHEFHTHKLTISVPEYEITESDGTQDRSGLIEFIYDDKSTNTQIVTNTVEIVQDGPEIERPHDEYWQGSYSFAPQSSSQEIFFIANYDFKIEHNDWFTVKSEAIEHDTYTHKLTVTVPDYPISDSNWSSRSGQIRFMYHDKINNLDAEVDYIDIYQYAPTAYTSRSYIYFSAVGAKDTIDISANCLFTTSRSHDWIHIENIIKDNSTYNAQLIVSLDEFPIETSSSSYRYGNIKLYYYEENSDIVKELDNIYIEQKSHTITTSQTTAYEINQNAQTISLEIDAEAEWTGQTDYSWITLNTLSGGKGKNNITLNVAELPAGTNSRTGYVYFKLFDNTKLTITINQTRID